MIRYQSRPVFENEIPLRGFDDKGNNITVGGKENTQAYICSDVTNFTNCLEIDFETWKELDDGKVETVYVTSRGTKYSIVPIAGKVQYIFNMKQGRETGCKYWQQWKAKYEWQIPRESLQPALPLGEI